MAVARRAALTVAAALVTLSGCGPADPNPEPDPTTAAAPDRLSPGACLVAGPANAPLVTEDQLVDCEQPHAYELLARQDVPSEYFDNGVATAADRERLVAALGGTGEAPLQAKFATYAHAYCTIAAQRLAGLDEAEFGGDGADRVLARADTTAWRPTPLLNKDADWLRQPLLICVNAVGGAPDEAAEPVSGPITRALITADLPLEWRSCFTLDASGDEAAVPCSRRHVGESAVTFDATRLLDEDQLAAETVRAPRPFGKSVQALLTDACIDVLPVLIGEDYDEEDVTARAVRGQGWEPDSVRNEARCQFIAGSGAEADLPPGSLFGLGDENVALVPVPEG